MLMALIMFLSLTTPALAVTSEEETAVALTMEESFEILGITMEEVEGLELMPMPTTTTNAERKLGGIPSKLPPGVYYEEVGIDHFRGALHTIKGPRFKWSYTVGEVYEDPLEIFVAMRFTNIYRQGDHFQDAIKVGYKYESVTYKDTNNEQIYFDYQVYSYMSHNLPAGKALLVIVVYQTP